jgi:hypothetical protein
VSGEPAGNPAPAAHPTPGQESAPGGWDGRFPGFDTAAQAGHWDPVTAGVVLSRLRIPQELGFFTAAEEAAATALCDQLLGQAGAGARRIPAVVLIDARLARMETDGWRYADMPEDAQAWRACTAFYSHPRVWDEIGFPGPAYPRGYKHAGVDAREPFEVADHHPADDPVQEGY